MVAVFTFWSKPFDSTYSGFFSPYYFQTCVAVSALKAKEYFTATRLFTDSQGVIILKELIDLKLFDEVVIAFQGFEIPDRHWVFSKLITYTMQTEPFLHIDYDAFFRKQPPRFVYEAGIIVQCQEEAYRLGHPYLYQIPVIEACKSKPKGWISDWHNYSDYWNLPLSHNMGIFGGQQVDFIRQYATDALAWLKNNFELTEVSHSIEQLYLTMRAHRENVSIVSLLEDWSDDKAVTELGFVHFWAGTKKMKDENGIPVIHRVVDYLKQYFPQIHERLTYLFERRSAV